MHKLLYEKKSTQFDVFKSQNYGDYIFARKEPNVSLYHDSCVLFD